MEQKPTNEMMDALTAAPDVQSFLEENAPFMVNDSLPGYLSGLLEEQKLSKAEVLKKAEINDIYGYQIFAGKRRPSRDKLVCIGLGLRLGLEGMQALLKTAGLAPLYPKNKRDSYLIFGVEKGSGVLEINRELYEAGLETLN